MMKIVNIDPKENIITGRAWKTVWYDKDATGYEEKFRAEVKSAVAKSKFPDLIVEDVTVRTGGCFSPYKSEQFEAVQIYSQKDGLESIRSCFTATQFGNVMHLSIYFIVNQEGGCAKIISKITSLFSGGGFASLKGMEYDQAFRDFIWMLLTVTIDKLPTKPAYTEEGTGDNGKRGGGLFSKLSKIVGG